MYGSALGADDDARAMQHSELEGSETADCEERNDEDPDHEHRERAEITVEPKRCFYTHDAPQSYRSNHFVPARSPVMALTDWSLRQVDWFKCGGWGFPAVPFRGIAVTARGALRSWGRMGKDAPLRARGITAQGALLPTLLRYRYIELGCGAGHGAGNAPHGLRKPSAAAGCNRNAENSSCCIIAHDIFG
jgi:hypothetical protein